MPTLTPSPVTEIAAADPTAALKHFETLLGCETDCWDVHAALTAGQQDFVLLDVRSPEAYRQAHVPGAVNLPYRRIAERTLSDFPKDAVFVVYCAGAHCNGADRAALQLSRLGRKVKKMLGGMHGWDLDGFETSAGQR
jgi:rhodanese-related sulfurtransferase